MEQIGDSPDEVTFRPSKRRKTYRRKAEEQDDSIDSLPEPIVSDQQSSSTVQEDHAIFAAGTNIEEISSSVRQRLLGRGRRVGVGFSSSPGQRTSQSAQIRPSTEMVLSNEPADAIPEPQSRFVVETGRAAVKEDAHMTAYIDSKLLEMRRSNRASMLQSHQVPTSSNCLESEMSQTSEPGSTTNGFRTTRSGDLEEVQVESTTGSRSDQPGAQRIKKPRVRIGRNGKPLPPRKPRNQRTSDDIARDALVERLLSENSMGNVFAPPPSSSSQQTGQVTGAAPGQDEDADRRAAEDFQRAFMADAEEARAKRQIGPPPSRGPTVGADMKGPKLGGSRSQRAAMAGKEGGTTKK